MIVLSINTLLRTFSSMKFLWCLWEWCPSGLKQNLSPIYWIKVNKMLASNVKLTAWTEHLSSVRHNVNILRCTVTDETYPDDINRTIKCRNKQNICRSWHSRFCVYVDLPAKYYLLMPLLHKRSSNEQTSYWSVLSGFNSLRPGQVTHICVNKPTTIGSDNVLSPGRRQVIIWTNAGILLNRPLGTNLSEILSEIRTFSLKKMHLKMSSGKWRPFCLGLNVLIGIIPEYGWY